MKRMWNKNEISEIAKESTEENFKISYEKTISEEKFSIPFFDFTYNENYDAFSASFLPYDENDYPLNVDFPIYMKETPLSPVIMHCIRIYKAQVIDVRMVIYTGARYKDGFTSVTELLNYFKSERNTGYISISGRFVGTSGYSGGVLAFFIHSGYNYNSLVLNGGRPDASMETDVSRTLDSDAIIEDTTRYLVLE